MRIICITRARSAAVEHEMPAMASPLPLRRPLLRPILTNAVIPMGSPITPNTPHGKTPKIPSTRLAVARPHRFGGWIASTAEGGEPELIEDESTGFIVELTPS